MLRSFWIAGFDGTDHLDGLRPAQHPAAYRQRVEADYRHAAAAGVKCVRENVGWRSVARGHGFDFAALTMRAQLARESGLQVIWTLCSNGWPDDVDVPADSFVERFRTFAGAVARALAPYTDTEPRVYTPINEISFVSWALANTNWFGPRCRGRTNCSDELRAQLVRATLGACDAILAVDPDARFVHPEPAMPASMSTRGQTHGQDDRFASWDMLAGHLEPQLGGHPRYLDALAVHLHRTPQWRMASPEACAIGPAETMGQPPLSRLLDDVYARYGCPIVVAETNRASGRATWLRELADEIGAALEHGVPVIGACLCRIVERPAWEDPRLWRGRRLWDVLLPAAGDSPRVPNSAYEQALRDVRARIDPLLEHPLPR